MGGGKNPRFHPLVYETLINIDYFRGGFIRVGAFFHINMIVEEVSRELSTTLHSFMLNKCVLTVRNYVRVAAQNFTNFTKYRATTSTSQIGVASL